MSQRKWTEQQEELLRVDAAGRPQLFQVAVLADAGSGKTSVLVERVKQILLKQPQSRCLCVSFTEKSAADLKARLMDFPSAEVYTIHGFCLKLIQEQSAVLGLNPLSKILDASETKKILYESFEKVSRRLPPSDLFSSMQWFQLCKDLYNQAWGDDFQVIESDPNSNSNAETFLKAVFLEYLERKQKLSFLEYSDLEELALKALQVRSVAAQYRKRYQHLFVDEFQDTSETQCGLVRLLSGPEQSLFVVGDSKQSIYRFRGANVKVFEKFVNEIPAVRYLSTNFRSQSVIIDEVNRVCGSIIENYQPMTAFHGTDPTLPQMDGKHAVAQVISSDEATGLIRALEHLKAQGRSLSELVLLLPRIRSNEEILQQLEKAGIPVVVGASSAADFSYSLQSLIQLWIAVCMPWLPMRSAHALVTFEKQRELLLGRLNRDSFEQIAFSEEPLSLLKNLQNTYSLQNKFGIFYFLFFDFILRKSLQSMSSTQIALELESLYREDEEFSDVPVLLPPKDQADALKVFTIHASKGLEFPVVLLADLDRAQQYRKPYYLKDRKIYLAGRDEDGKITKSEDLLNLIEKELQEARSESARLLYVALTRAEDALYSVVPLSDKKPKDFTWNSWMQGSAVQIKSEDLEISDLSLSQKSLPAPGVLALPEGGCAASHPGPLSRRTPLQLQGANQKSPNTITRMGVTKYLRPDQAKKKNIKITDSFASMQRAAALGSRLHRILELQDWQALDRFAELNQFSLDKFNAWRDSDVGAKVFGGAEISFSEYEIENLVKSNTILTGRIDKLLLWPSRKEAWVVDYKLLHGKRSAEELKNIYESQVQVYCDAVKKLFDYDDVKGFILDVAASTDSIWHCILG